jgi:hypothetical protein
VDRKKLQTPYDDLTPDQLLQLEDLVKNFISNVKAANIEPLETMLQMMGQRWSHFLRQPAKVDSTMQRTIHHEDAETVFGGVQGQGRT